MSVAAGLRWVPADWGTVFTPHGPILELVVRAASIYLLLFLILRLLPKREVGRFTVADLLIIFLLATSVREALTGQYPGVADGAITFLTLVACHTAVNLLSLRFPVLRPFLRSSPRAIVSDGRIDHRQAHRALLTDDDVWEKLREAGVTSLDGIRTVFLEPNGKISVIRDDEPEGEGEREAER